MLRAGLRFLGVSVLPLIAGAILAHVNVVYERVPLIVLALICLAAFEKYLLGVLLFFSYALIVVAPDLTDSPLINSGAALLERSLSYGLAVALIYFAYRFFSRHRKRFPLWTQPLILISLAWIFQLILQSLFFPTLTETIGYPFYTHVESSWISMQMQNVSFLIFIFFVPMLLLFMEPSSEQNPARDIAGVFKTLLSPIFIFGFQIIKGFDYLQKLRQRDFDKKVRTQLRGLYFLCVGVIYLWLANFYLGEAGQAQILSFFGISNYASCSQNYFDCAIKHMNDGVYQSWILLALDHLRAYCFICSVSHVVVGLLGLAAFRLPPATYFPFISVSIQQYFNRFNYYYKEFLQQVFFLPTFFSLNRWPGALRVFASLFFTLFIGNWFMHLWFENLNLYEGLKAAYTHNYAREKSDFFYYLLLSLGVWVSQLNYWREAPLKLKRFLFWTGPLRVNVFFLFIHCFGTTSDLSLTERFIFLGKLVGLS